MVFLQPRIERQGMNDIEVVIDEDKTLEMGCNEEY